MRKKFGLLLLVTVLFSLLLPACGDTPTQTSAAGFTGFTFQLPTTTGTTIATTQSTTPVPTTTVATSTVALQTTVAKTTTVVPITTLPPIQRYNPVFALYKELATSLKPSFPTYKVDAKLGNVTNLVDFKLSDAQKKLLEQNYFVVEPADFKQFFQAYESFRYDQIPTYISTDSVAHVYHLLFDKMLRETEKTFLIKDLTQLTQALFEASLQQYNTCKGTNLEDAATRTLAFTAVAYKLVNPKADIKSLPSNAATLVTREMSLIDKAGGFDLSPIMGSDYQEDYSQYTPRGHYTKSDDLKNYFRAMMWLGRMNFRLKVDSETTSAILLAQAMLNGKSGNRTAKELWQLIYEPTSFFVGTSDDLTVIDYANLATAVWGVNGAKDPKSLLDTAKMGMFKTMVNGLPAPRINSMFTTIDLPQDLQIKGMRLMGQRFTLDAYLFQNLVWRRVGTLERPRDIPKGLDIFASFGSDQAQKLLQQSGENNYLNYSTQLDKMVKQVGAIDYDTWTQNLYWSWLYNLKPLTEKRGEGYPAYMQNEAWQRKQLVTGLASWTELKHDTLLYAKQIYAEKGGGPEELPTGFVEPETAFYARMSALAQMTRTGLEQRNLIDKTNSDMLKKLENDATTLRVIAEKELTGKALTDDEKQFIAYWGAKLEEYTIAAADDEGNQGRKYIENQDAALVADVATGLEDVLEEATGRINLIYVAVPVNGKVILTKGAVYSQYEFTVKPANRLTDEAWQQMLNTGKAPALADWKKSYMAK